MQLFWNEQTYIKRVYLEEDGLRLVSINKKYKDKFAPYDDDPRIVGKLLETLCLWRTRLWESLTIQKSLSVILPLLI